MKRSKRIRSVLNKAIGPPELFDWEHRFYNSILIVSIAIAFFGAIMNFSLELSKGLIYMTYLSLAFCLLFYMLSRFYKKYFLSKLLFSIVLIFMLFIFFLTNSGSDGPVLYLYLITFLFLLFVWDKKFQLFFILLFTVNLLCLLMLEYFFPQFFSTYPDPKSRIIDVYSSLLVYMFIGIIIITTAKNNFIRERDRARESERLKTAFLMKISHEIRTPLHAITSFADIICNQYTDPNDKKEFYKIIREKSDYLTRLINDLIDISVIETGNLTLNYVQTNIHEMINELQEKYSKILLQQSKTEISLKVRKPENSLCINTDPARLRQIFDCLLSNAVKYIVKGEISLGYNLRENYVRFFVRDTGIGISETVRTRIFNKFEQFDDNNSENTLGIGLGLPLAKELIRLMGGEIWVESEPGIGTIFYFTLPREIIHPIA